MELAAILGVLVVMFLFVLLAGWITLMVLCSQVRKMRLENERIALENRRV